MATASFRSDNPVLRDSIFKRARSEGGTQRTATLQGTIVKTYFLLGILFVTVTFAWLMLLKPVPPGPTGSEHYQLANALAAFGLLFLASLAALVLTLLVTLKPQWSMGTAPLTTAVMGLALGTLTAMGEHIYAGLGMEAAGLTIGVLLVLLAACRMGLVKVTERFKAGFLAALGAILLVYLFQLVLRLFGVRLPFIHETGWVGIGFSLLIVGLAVFSLLSDLERIDRYIKQGGPPYLEWYCGYSLVLSLVWLYLSIFWLLIKKAWLSYRHKLGPERPQAR